MLPKVGCELEEKERFWSELDEVMESIPTGERVVIGADFNGHVGEGNRGDEEVMGKFGVKERNLEGQMVVDFAKRMDMAVVNTYFQKREEHRVNYRSGGQSLQNTLPEVDPANHQVVIAHQGAIILRVKLQATSEPAGQPPQAAAPPTAHIAATLCCEPFRLALPEKFDGAADRCCGFLWQCENYFVFQPHVYQEETTKCTFFLSLLTGKALDWAPYGLGS
ncbi:hypothetical protein QTP70_003164 [Hemibagrus guttatus]|uniref:DUF4939 domain-containing protein n=1 Tax=Hemibagrus guttatus TaxID=175788 RepID=A0AAE0QHK4_9TELE|nr:hypothetical protein QTP70_003164 [Hemibagrus guttatus]